MKEVWKDIHGFEGEYKVSNMGRMKSFKDCSRGRVLSNNNRTGWYLGVILTHKGERKGRSIKIHQLIAECFLNYKPTRRFHIHHKDGNKQNNHVNNLEVIPVAQHKFISMIDNPDLTKGMNHYNQEIRPNIVMQFDLNGNYISEYRNCTDAGKATGVCKRNIHQVASESEYKPGKIRMQAGGFIWKFKNKTNAA